MTKTIPLLYAAICALALVGCATKRPTQPIVYNRYNIHVITAYDRGGTQWVKGSYTGWIGPVAGHRIIPPNTPMVIGGSDVIHRQPGFWLYLADGTDVFFEYNKRNMRRSYLDYVYNITSSDYVNYDKLSDIDRKGILQGKALVGMSKQGVMISLGIPAMHQTPTLESDRWIYWRSRNSRRVGVYFDKSGIVTKVR